MGDIKLSENVVSYSAPKAGIFIPSAKYWGMLCDGDEIGRIVDSLSGEVISKITSHDRGILFSICDCLTVDKGSLVGRLVKC